MGPHGMSTVDPGNIRDRSDRECYISEAKALPAGAKVQSISWEGLCTSTSWVQMEMRAAAEEKSLEQAPWISVNAGEDLSHLGLAGVIQYRLGLCAKCGCGTPRITEVTVEYSV